MTQTPPQPRGLRALAEQAERNATHELIVQPPETDPPSDPPPKRITVENFVEGLHTSLIIHRADQASDLLNLGLEDGNLHRIIFEADLTFGERYKTGDIIDYDPVSDEWYWVHQSPAHLDHVIAVFSETVLNAVTYESLLRNSQTDKIVHIVTVAQPFRRTLSGGQGRNYAAGDTWLVEQGRENKIYGLPGGQRLIDAINNHFGNDDWQEKYIIDDSFPDEDGSDGDKFEFNANANFLPGFALDYDAVTPLRSAKRGDVFKWLDSVSHWVKQSEDTIGTIYTTGSAPPTNPPPIEGQLFEFNVNVAAGLALKDYNGTDDITSADRGDLFKRIGANWVKQSEDEAGAVGGIADNSVLPVKARANSGAEKLAWFSRFGIPILDFEVDPLYFPQDHVGALNYILHLRVHRPEALTGTTHLAVGLQGTNITQAWTPASDTSLLVTIPAASITNLKTTITAGSLTDLDCELRFGSAADVATSDDNLVQRFRWSLKVIPTDPYRIIAPPIVSQIYTAGAVTINDANEHVLQSINIKPTSVNSRVDLAAFVETKTQVGGQRTPRNAGTELRLYRGSTLLLARKFQSSNYAAQETVDISRSIRWVDHPNTTDRTIYTVAGVRLGDPLSWSMEKRQMIAQEVLNYVAPT